MTLWLRLGQTETPRSICYRLAGQRICSDTPLEVLAPWRIDSLLAPMPSTVQVFAPAGMPHDLGTYWLGNRWRALRFWRTGERIRLQIEAAGEWLIDFERHSVQKLTAAPHDPGLIAEIALGPGLILLLANRDIFCLHASGVLIADRAYLFPGDSGDGKSTLARADTWRRISDDIAPVMVDEGGAWALPHFPQLKLGATAQYSAAEPSRWPLGALCLLSPVRGERCDTVTATLLKPAEAVRAIVAHTVASRLFTPRLMSMHMAYAALLAQCVPVYRLQYPWGIDRLPALGSVIAGLEQ